jgi:2-dehydro-3-deoxyphosphogluconate aldolase/(4S)-4-hydroxy-2-oxoglutarate aldolase
MEPKEFLTLYKSQGASAILRTPDTDLAREAMNAAVRGGFRVIEFTLSIPDAYSLIREFSGRKGLVVGAGTVLTREEAEKSVEAGARFLVSPVLDLEIVAVASELGVAMMPGSATPTEMLKGHRAGAQLQKLFPEQGIGPLWVRQTLGPLPFLNIVPTSGGYS